MPRVTNTESFIKKAISVHGDTYDYSQTVYVHNKAKVTIVCPKHGLFQQRPDTHLKGSHCHYCHMEKMHDARRIDQDEFLKRAKIVHGNFYNYSKVEYKRFRDPVTIICPRHGEFQQTPHSHLKGSRCPSCVRFILDSANSDNQETFLQKAIEIHQGLYDYSLVRYTSSKEKVTIVCPKHGEFLQMPANHLRGQRCPNCFRSKGEELIAAILDNLGIEYEYQKQFDTCKHKKKLPFDFFIPAQRLLIEYHGQQHYESIDFWGGDKGLKYRQKLDNIKRVWAKNNRYQLIEIPYTQIETVDRIVKELFN